MLRYRPRVRFAYHVMSSPLGLLFIARSERGLRHLEFMDRKSIKRMISTHRERDPESTWEPSLLENKDAVDQLEAYFCGASMRFNLRVDAVGSEFQHAVWNELVKIPYGETRTYGDIAKAIGQPRSARAVGLANNQNPVAIVVPCHRVIGANKSLTGYGGGLHRKRWLLQHEARFARQGEPEADLFAAASSRTGSRREAH
jgi:methylated-DNA-[protein]-cysteine S-methyltransferase